LEKAVPQQQKKLDPFCRQFPDFLANRLLVTMTAGGAGEWPSECDDLQKRYPEQSIEAILNRAGYKLLGASLFSEAIGVFRLNTDRYPRSANAWDSLAEAYMVSGDKAKAVANYEKSLRLNPKNQNAADKLKQLRGEHS
jgi:tetratricopeptide (TPR) repeat protein